MSTGSKQRPSVMKQDRLFCRNTSCLHLTRDFSFCMRQPESVPWREQMMYHLIPPSFDILFLSFFFLCCSSLEGHDEGVVNPPTRKLRKCEHCAQAREEYTISLWYRRRVSIFLIYIQTSCCLVGNGWWGHAGRQCTNNTLGSLRVYW